MGKTEGLCMMREVASLLILSQTWIFVLSLEPGRSLFREEQSFICDRVSPASENGWGERQKRSRGDDCRW